MDGNLYAGLRQMGQELSDMALDPDHPLVRAVLQASDPEATAWAWAAGVKIGLSPKQVIMDHEYDGTGQHIRIMLQSCRPVRGRVTGYVGLHGLAHAGMTSLHNRGPLPMYPELANWLQID